MSDSLLDAFTPIGPLVLEPSTLSTPGPDAPRRRGRPTGSASTLSTREKRQRRLINQSNRDVDAATPFNAHAAVRAASKRLGVRGLGPDLTLEEAKQQAATLARQFYQDAKEPDTATPTTARRLVDQKHAAVAWAIVIDKWTILSGRPTQIIGVTDSPEQRDALRALGLKLLKLQQTEATA